MLKILWHSLSVRETLRRLKTSSAKGLNLQEAEERKKKYGHNALPEEKRLTAVKIFFSQFKNPLIYILLIAAIITFTLREFIDMFVILLAVALNTIIGFIQENKANKAITYLRKLVKHRARVIRGETEHEVGAEDLVPGDIVLLQAGDRVPADARIIQAKDFQTDEAPLTGEATPVNKIIQALEKGVVMADRKNMIFMGTTVTRGKALAVVTETGKHTFLGETASLIKETSEDKTPLQLRLTQLGKWIAAAVAFISLVILVLGILADKSFVEMFIMAVAIAVSATPEGLVVAVTVILAIGMQRILKKGSLVRNLVAAETLGSTTVICTDKTGTLTEGRMQVTEIYTGRDLLERKDKKYQELDWQSIKESSGHLFALTIGLACNNAAIENPEEDLSRWSILGDPTERALLLAAYHAGLNKEKIDKRTPRLDEIPFDSDKKYMATLNKGEKHHWIYMKGAPEKLLERSRFLQIDGKKKKISPKVSKELQNAYEKLTSRGLRLLAVGYREVSPETNKLAAEDLENIVLVGFIGLKDPLRKEVPATLALTQRAGIKTLMVTGDHRLTAKAIAEEAGLKIKEKNIIEGAELEEMDDDELNKRIEDIKIFSRVTPRHKIRIVDILQARGEVVAMTGDGVNDAPAIKSADIGVALGSGSDVTKETADIVLLDNNFKTIVEAVKQGRTIFDNIKKVIVYLMSDSFSEIILIGGSLLLGLPLPLLPAQILWVNIVNDSLPVFALSFEKSEKEVMEDRPRPKEAPIMDIEMKVLIFIIGVITSFIIFALYVYFLQTGSYTIKHLNTFVYAAITIDSLFFIYACRSFRHNIWHYNPFTNHFLNISVLLGFVSLLISIYWEPIQILLRTVPLNFYDWTFLIILGMINLFFIEITKWFFIVKKHRRKK